MKKSNIENAKCMVGPAFEELSEGAMMEVDGEATEWISILSKTISSWASVSGIAVSIITYCIIND